MRYLYDREPMIDPSVIALVAVSLIAKGQSTGADRKLADRVLALAVEHLDANQAEVEAERKRRCEQGECAVECHEAGEG